MFDCFSMSETSSSSSATEAWFSEECKLLSGVAQDMAPVPLGLRFDRHRGIFIPSVASEAHTPLTMPTRRWTWEDTLNVSRFKLRPHSDAAVFNWSSHRLQAIRVPSDLEKLTEIRSSHRCRRQWHCDAMGLPPAIGTVQRPVKAFVVRIPAERKMYFALPIEKAGLSSFDEFFRRVALRLNVNSWVIQTRRAHCRNRTNLQLIEEVEALARWPPYNAEALDRACGLASSFALQGLEGVRKRTTFAVVREPVARFISGFNDHGTSVQRARLDVRGSSVTVSSTQLMRELEQHAADLAKGRFKVALVPPHASIHFLSQSYFLSGTDAHGKPIHWDLIARLEQIDQEMSGIASELLRGGGNAPKRETPTSPRSPFPHRNAKTNPQTKKTLLNQIRRRPALMCNICRVYGQDFVCLGYPIPGSCLRPACLDTLRPPLQRAFRSIRAKSTTFAH